MKTANKILILAALSAGLSACASDGFVTDSYTYSTSAHYGPPASELTTVVDDYNYDHYYHHYHHPRIHVHGGGYPHFGPSRNAAHYGPPSSNAHYGPAKSGGGAHFGPPRHSTPSTVSGGGAHAHYGPPSISQAHFGPPR